MRPSVPHYAAVIALGLGIVITTPPTVADTAEVTYVDLGVQSGVAEAEATYVNDRGLVVGKTRAVDSSDYRPSTWDSSGRLTVLPALPGSTDGPNPTAVNDRNEIVGYTVIPGDRWHAVRWNNRGVITDLGSPPDTIDLFPEAINNSGVIIGSANSPAPDNRSYAVRWDPHGRVGILPGGQSAHASAINDRGTIVGYGSDNVAWYALSWDRAGRAHRLPRTDGYQTSEAVDINNRGFVAGEGSDATGDHGLVWSPSGEVTVLPDSPTGSMRITGINERGTVLGNAAGGYGNPVRWTDGRLLPLGILPGSLASTARDLDDHDLVIGAARVTSRHEVPVWWDAAGSPHELPCPTGSYACRVDAINNQDVAVGVAYVTTQSGMEDHALLWRLRG